jgi:hypothetical protein
MAIRTRFADSGRGLKQQNPPREEVRWVSLVMEAFWEEKRPSVSTEPGGGDAVENS